jgi:hypothetical protein
MNLRLMIVCLGLGLTPAFLAGQDSKVDLKAEEAAIRVPIEKRVATQRGQLHRVERCLQTSGGRFAGW